MKASEGTECRWRWMKVDEGIWRLVEVDEGDEQR